MTEDKPTRRALMRPAQLLGLAFVAAVFAGVVTLVAMGFFQSRFDGQGQRALVVAGVIAGITFIVVLVAIALLILAVDPAAISKPIDRPVLYDPEAETEADAGAGAEEAADPEERPSA